MYEVQSRAQMLGVESCDVMSAPLHHGWCHDGAGLEGQKQFWDLGGGLQPVAVGPDAGGDIGRLAVDGYLSGPNEQRRAVPRLKVRLAVGVELVGEERPVYGGGQYLFDEHIGVDDHRLALPR